MKLRGGYPHQITANRNYLLRSGAMVIARDKSVDALSFERRNMTDRLRTTVDLRYRDEIMVALQ